MPEIQLCSGDFFKTSGHAKVVSACKSALGQDLGHLFFSHKVVLRRDFILKRWTSLTSTDVQAFSKSCSGFKKCSFECKCWKMYRNKVRIIDGHFRLVKFD